MKKITRVMLFAAGLGMSMAASAGTSIPTGSTIDRDGTISNLPCVLLGEGVTINLSKNVSAAYSCDALNLDIRVAACHAAGSRKATQIDCAVIGVGTDGTTPIYNNSACTGVTGQQYAIANFRIFEGSSRGGTVAAVDLGGPCTDATAAGVAYLP